METSNKLIKRTAYINFFAINSKKSFQNDFENAAIISLDPALNFHEFYIKEQEEMPIDTISLDAEINLNDIDDAFLENENVENDTNFEDNQNYFGHNEYEDFFNENYNNLIDENLNIGMEAKKNDYYF